MYNFVYRRYKAKYRIIFINQIQNIAFASLYDTYIKTSMFTLKIFKDIISNLSYILHNVLINHLRNIPGFISAITWPTSLLTLASLIDNPWGVCIRRSAEAGKQLAQVLIQRYHGRRPVTLIGFSLGARVIYYCLQELALKEGSAGIVQDAILLGAPVPGYAEDWKKIGKFFALSHFYLLNLYLIRLMFLSLLKTLLCSFFSNKFNVFIIIDLCCCTFIAFHLYSTEKF